MHNYVRSKIVFYQKGWQPTGWSNLPLLDPLHGNQNLTQGKKKEKYKQLSKDVGEDKDKGQYDSVPGNRHQDKHEQGF